MELVEAAYLILGVVLGIVGIALVRWLLLRPAQRTLTASLIEELNCFNAQLRRLTDRMTDLRQSVESRSTGTPAGQQIEITETLSEMKRLLSEINEFFVREEAEASGLRAGDFVDPDEQDKFQRMEQISDDEIARANWDDLLDRLRDEEE